MSFNLNSSIALGRTSDRPGATVADITYLPQVRPKNVPRDEIHPPTVST